MINVITSSRYKVERAKLREAASKLLTAKGLANGYNLNLVFVGKNKMRKLASKYKKEDVALPVLSFPYNEKAPEGVLLGEVVICFPQAVLLAAQRNRKVNETILQLVDHGIDNLI